MSRIRCGIKTAKLGSTVFGRRKPISKGWWKGLWPAEDEDPDPTQLSNQETPTVLDDRLEQDGQQEGLDAS